MLLPFRNAGERQRVGILPTRFWFRNSFQAGTNFLIARSTGTQSPVATVGTGWGPGTTAAVAYSLMKAGNAQDNTTFGGTALPNTTPSNVAQDCLVTEGPLKGTYKAGTWTIAMGLIGAGSTVAGGNLRVRVYRGTLQDGSGTNVEITSGAVDLSTVTNLDTVTQQNTTATFSPGAITLNKEFLFFQFAWKITSASGASSASVRLRTDYNNSYFLLPQPVLGSL